MLLIGASVQAATILNSTTFDGSESTTDGNLATYSNVSGLGFDTVNGWTWGTNLTGLPGGPANGGVLAGLNTVRDQEIRSFELQTGVGAFDFGFGNTGIQGALAQGFTVNLGEIITVTYDMVSSVGGMYLYVDNGSGNYGFQDHAMANGTGNTYSFTATGTAIRIAVFSNDGVDSDAVLQAVSVESIPESSVFGLGGLGGLLLLRRRRN